MWIKICGITRLEDALSAARFGADAVGFVFADSPGCITPDRAREVSRRVAGRLSTVGVFVDSPPDEVLRIAGYCGLDLVQLYSNEDAECCDALGRRVIKALKVSEKSDLLKVRDGRCRAVLLDGYAETKRGGNGGGGNGGDGHGRNGKRIDWKMLQVIKNGSPVIVAGGLEPGNVAATVKEAHPYGVDVSSGVESSPGIKDPVLMYEFIERARKADYELRGNECLQPTCRRL